MRAHIWLEVRVDLVYDARLSWVVCCLTRNRGTLPWCMGESEGVYICRAIFVSSDAVLRSYWASLPSTRQSYSRLSHVQMTEKGAYRVDA